MECWRTYTKDRPIAADNTQAHTLAGKMNAAGVGRAISQTNDDFEQQDVDGSVYVQYRQRSTRIVHVHEIAEHDLSHKLTKNHL